MGVPFLKMNGLGNDFVVVPEADGRFEPTRREVRAIADRVSGIGCDQLIAITRSERADARMRIWNADGGEVENCGNAARCVAWLLMRASGRETASIEIPTGVLQASRAGEWAVSIDMGAPALDWRQVPLATGADTRAVEIELDPDLGAAGAVSMGNPHVVFFVADAGAAPVREAGPRIEHHWLFPERANVGFAQVIDDHRIRLKVWERGVGQTLACGTGACAALVAAARRGLCARSAVVELDGGELHIDWRESDGHVIMTGPVTLEYAGRLSEPRMAA